MHLKTVHYIALETINIFAYSKIINYYNNKNKSKIISANNEIIQKFIVYQYHLITINKIGKRNYEI